jgi:hypothetical protein
MVFFSKFRETNPPFVRGIDMHYASGPEYREKRALGWGGRAKWLLRSWKKCQKWL